MPKLDRRGGDFLIHAGNGVSRVGVPRCRSGRRRDSACRLLGAGALFLLSCSCVGNLAYKKGQKALAREDLDSAVLYYMEAVRHEPDNVRFRVSLNQALFNASNYHLRLGDDFAGRGDLKLALLEYQKSLEFNSENNESRKKKQTILKKLEEQRRQAEEKTEIEKLKEKAGHVALAAETLAAGMTPLDLKLGDVDLRVLFKALQKSSSVKFLFDEGFQSKKVSVDFENVLFKDALEKILLQTKLFYKVIDSSTIIIVPNTPAKRREYDELTMRTFFLSNADPEQMQKLIGSLTGCKVMAVNPDLGTLTVRDLPAKVAMAGRLVQIMDKPKPELLIDVEIIEVNKSRLRKYGIELSDYAVSEAFSPGTYASDKAVVVRGNRFSYVNSSDFVFQVPSLVYRLMQNDSKTKIKAKPQLRVVDKETVKVKLGDKVPIVTTTFVPSYGSTSVNNQPITSYQMQDVGINIELTPHIHHDGWISMKLKFELTFITGKGADSLPPTIGNRSVETMIRLQDNETSMLAGLLRDTEIDNRNGIPILSDLPILKEIFSGNSRQADQTDIILTITPRIVKFPQIDDEDLLSYWIGTEEEIGLKGGPPRSPFGEDEAPPEADAAKKAKEEARAWEKTVPTASAVKKEPVPAPEIGKEPQQAPEIKKEVSSVAVSERQPPAEGLAGRMVLAAEPGVMASGEPFVLKLMTEGIKDLMAMEVELEFAPRELKLVDVGEGAFFKSGEARGHFFKTFDNATGRATVSLAFNKAEDVDSKEMVLFRFQALAAGELGIRVRKARFFDAGRREIRVTAGDVMVTVRESK